MGASWWGYLCFLLVHVLQTPQGRPNAAWPGIFVGVNVLAMERFIPYITSLANVGWVLLCK